MHKELFGAHAQVSIEDPLTLDGDLHDATIKTRMQALCVKRSGNTKTLAAFKPAPAAAKQTSSALGKAYRAFGKEFACLL